MTTFGHTGITDPGAVRQNTEIFSGSKVAASSTNGRLGEVPLPMRCAPRGGKLSLERLNLCRFIFYDTKKPAALASAGL